MRDDLFSELVDSIHEAGAILRGEVVPGRRFTAIDGATALGAWRETVEIEDDLKEWHEKSIGQFDYSGIPAVRRSAESERGDD